jgi:hypothetical protein
MVSLAKQHCVAPSAGENVFVWFASFAGEVALRDYHSALTQSQEWIISIVPALQMWGAKLQEALELLPTRRSLLRHHAQEQETRKDFRELTFQLPDDSTPFGKCVRRRVHEEYLIWLTTVDTRAMPQPAPVWF